MKYFKKHIWGVVVITLLSACSKNNDPANPPHNKGTLNFLVKDNFTLGFFAVALNRTGLEKQLVQPGPYTLLAPSDDAFKAAGFFSQADVFNAPVANLSVRSAYHILSGEQVILSKPLGFNQPLKTVGGTTVYLSRVKKGPDTLTTINGARLLKADTRASNGLMQVIDRLLVPNVFDKVGDALSANVDLSLFYQALKRSGLLAEVNGSGSYTIYALNNAAMRQNGYNDVTVIEGSDPAALKALLSYHIAKNMKFAQDYFLLAAPGQIKYTETMLDDRAITIQILTEYNNPNIFAGIKVMQGPDEWNGITPLQTDILAGNGVIHVLDRTIR